jgi:hypothetical protein
MLRAAVEVSSAGFTWNPQQGLRAMFPVKRPAQNSGRLDGVRRGNRSGHGRTCSKHAIAPLRPVKARPRSANSASGQARSSGGSLTSSRPRTARNGAPDSAVTAGGANPRAVTSWRLPRRAGSWPSTSARSSHTSTRSSSPSVRMARPRNRARRPFDSTSAHRLWSQSRARGSAGTPPPLPRSRAVAGSGPSHASAKPRAWVRWSWTGPGPRKPRSRASSSTASSSVSPGRRA